MGVRAGGETAHERDREDRARVEASQSVQDAERPRGDHHLHDARDLRVGQPRCQRLRPVLGHGRGEAQAFEVGLEAVRAEGDE